MSVVGPDGTRWPANSLRGLEHKSIRDFVQAAADDGYLSGRVLDYGCGKQPYRGIVEAAGAQYEGFDRADFPASVGGEDTGFVGLANWMWGFDAILCTQVLQYVPHDRVSQGNAHRGVLSLLYDFRMALGDLDNQDGYLVLTYPTNWPEVEPEDLHRFTKAGMERLLAEAGFEIVRHERRATAAVALSGESFATGYGVVARA